MVDETASRPKILATGIAASAGRVIPGAVRLAMRPVAMASCRLAGREDLEALRAPYFVVLFFFLLVFSFFSSCFAPFLHKLRQLA